MVDTKGDFLVRDKEMESERDFKGSFKILNFLYFKKKKIKNIVNKIISRCNHLHICA